MVYSHLRHGSSSSLISVAKPNLKRGWEPAFVEPCQSTITLASTCGYLDTPSKYRDMANALSMHNQTDEIPHPAKRRRGLAGSIVSTAVSAALIGSAVGLTVYRLWSNRSKNSKSIAAAASADSDSDSDYGSIQQLPPPPPYQERDWNPIAYSTPPAQEIPKPTPKDLPAPMNPSRKRSQRRSIKRSRRTRAQRTQIIAIPIASASCIPQSDFDFERNEDNDEMEVVDQIDWIGDKLTELIEEGKKALNKEVVVMSESQEDEVDDGSEAWEEEEETVSVSRSNSIRNGVKRLRKYRSSPVLSLQQTPSQTITPRRSCARLSDSVTKDVVKEDETAWQSTELRETMQKAREMVITSRLTS